MMNIDEIVISEEINNCEEFPSMGTDDIRV